MISQVCLPFLNYVPSKPMYPCTNWKVLLKDSFPHLDTEKKNKIKKKCGSLAGAEIFITCLGFIYVCFCCSYKLTDLLKYVLF